MKIKKILLASVVALSLGSISVGAFAGQPHSHSNGFNSIYTVDGGNALSGEVISQPTDITYGAGADASHFVISEPSGDIETAQIQVSLGQDAENQCTVTITDGDFQDPTMSVNGCTGTYTNATLSPDYHTPTITLTHS